MKKSIITLIKSIIILLILAAVCNYLYLWNHLDHIFGSKIRFEQWMAIIVIIRTINPTTELFSINQKDKDDK
jgi:hypothetical protein